MQFSAIAVLLSLRVWIIMSHPQSMREYITSVGGTVSPCLELHYTAHILHCLLVGPSIHSCGKPFAAAAAYTNTDTLLWFPHITMPPMTPSLRILSVHIVSAAVRVE